MSAVGVVWNGAQDIGRDMRGLRNTTLSDGLRGEVADEAFCGPGRYLGHRNPVPAYARDPEHHPGSAAVDAALRGDQPVIEHIGYESGTVTPGQIYNRPDTRDISRNARTGIAQVVRKIIRSQKQPAPARPPDTELPWERHAPHQEGLDVIRDHGGGAQVIPAGTGDRDIVSLLGREFFSDGQASPSPGPTCEHCHKAMPPGPPGSDKRFCSASCRGASWQTQKKLAAIDS